MASRTSLLVTTLLISLMLTTTQGNISLQLFEGEDGGSFQGALCNVFACDNDGGLEVINQMEDFVDGILNGEGADISINIDGGSRERKLRGSEYA
jgi:hypothetical protein